jgi:hypothetical protein
MSKTNPALQLRTSKGVEISLDDQELADAVAEVFLGEAKIVSMEDETLYDPAEQAVIA